MKYEIKITGYDWETCYLHEALNRKQQVLDDLQIEMDNLGIKAVIEHQFEIIVEDHSMAFEMFRIINIDQKNKNVEMVYAGGAS